MITMPMHTQGTDFEQPGEQPPVGSIVTSIGSAIESSFDWGRSPTIVKPQTGNSGTPATAAGQTAVGLDTLLNGRSLLYWKRERRNAATALRGYWEKVQKTMGTARFPVAADSFVDRLSAEIARFHGIPQEDIASGIFQLVEESLSGECFERVEKRHLDEPITKALQIASQPGPLSVESYDEALRLFVDAELRA